MERHTPAVENGPIDGASNVQEKQQPLPEVNNSNHLEDDRLIATARAVGVDYEFAKPCEVETGHDRRKRQRRNQRRISEREKRLREVYGDLPPPPQQPVWSGENNVDPMAVPEILSNIRGVTALTRAVSGEKQIYSGNLEILPGIGKPGKFFGKYEIFLEH